MKNNLALSWRAWVVYTTVFLIFLFVVVRIFAIQFNDRNFLESKGNTLLLTSREIPVLRAGIFDRNNFPLAVSVKQYNLFALRNFSEEDFKAINVITPLAQTFTEIDELKKKIITFSKFRFFAV